MCAHITTSLPKSPRLYIFGPEDKLISIFDIEAHVEKVRATGVDVRTEVFEGTQHVAHLRGGSERYWDAVKDLWLGRTA